MKKKQTLEQCNVIERNGQLVFTLNSEIMLPEEAPVRLTNAQLEELDYRKTVCSVFVQRTEIGHRSASAVQDSGIRIPMRYLHNEEIGRSLPLPYRLQVAAVG